MAKEVKSLIMKQVLTGGWAGDETTKVLTLVWKCGLIIPH